MKRRDLLGVLAAPLLSTPAMSALRSLVKLPPDRIWFLVAFWNGLDSALKNGVCVSSRNTMELEGRVNTAWTDMLAQDKAAEVPVIKCENREIHWVITGFESSEYDCNSSSYECVTSVTGLVLVTRHHWFPDPEGGMSRHLVGGFDFAVAAVDAADPMHRVQGTSELDAIKKLFPGILEV